MADMTPQQALDNLVIIIDRECKMTRQEALAITASLQVLADALKPAVTSAEEDSGATTQQGD